MNNDKIKYIEFIQNIITRMNNNSFQIKNWAVAIVTAMLAVYASTRKSTILIFAIFPTIIFWSLDTYYLMMERKFRGLCDDVAGVSENPPTNIKLFDMRTSRYKGGKYSFWNIFFSGTILKLYLSIVVILTLLFLICR